MQTHNHNVESLEGTVTSNNAESQTPTMQENICPHNHLHGYQLSAPKDVGLPNIPTRTTADDLPQAVWQKIVSINLHERIGTPDGVFNMLILYAF